MKANEIKLGMKVEGSTSNHQYRDYIVTGLNVPRETFTLGWPEEPTRGPSDARDRPFSELVKVGDSASPDGFKVIWNYDRK